MKESIWLIFLLHLIIRQSLLKLYLTCEQVSLIMIISDGNGGNYSEKFSSLTFSSKNFIVLALTFMSLIHFELIFVYGKGPTILTFFFFFFACGYLVFPAPFVEKIVHSLLNGLIIVVENYLSIYVRVYFWSLYSIILVYLYANAILFFILL